MMNCCEILVVNDTDSNRYLDIGLWESITTTTTSGAFRPTVSAMGVATSVGEVARLRSESSKSGGSVSTVHCRDLARGLRINSNSTRTIQVADWSLLVIVRNTSGEVELEMETYHPILVLTHNQRGQLTLHGYGSKIGVGEDLTMWSYGVPGVVSVTQSHRRGSMPQPRLEGVGVGAIDTVWTLTSAKATYQSEALGQVDTHLTSGDKQLTYCRDWAKPWMGARLYLSDSELLDAHWTLKKVGSSFHLPTPPHLDDSFYAPLSELHEGDTVLVQHTKTGLYLTASPDSPKLHLSASQRDNEVQHFYFTRSSAVGH